METPPDDPLVFHGVWIDPNPEPNPNPATPENATTRTIPRRRRLVIGFLLIVGGGVLGLLAGLILAHPVLGTAGGATVGLVGAGCISVIRQRKDEPKPPVRAVSAATPPLQVVYTPISFEEPDDPRLRELEEALIDLCQGDRVLFERLIDHERARYLECSRVELVELAIHHFRRDRHY